MPRIGCHLLLLLILSLSANGQQQFSALGGFPQHPSFQPFQHAFGVMQPFAQPAQFGVQPVQPVQPVQTFQQPSFPVQPQLNPIFPFTLPTFTFAPPVNPFIPFGQATPAPVYSTNQAVQPQQPQQGVQQPGQQLPQQQQQFAQGVQPQQPAVQQQIQPVAPQQQSVAELPTTLVAVQKTSTTTTPPPATTAEESTLPVVDSRIEPKKPKKNAIKMIKKEGNEEQPPETPKELTKMGEDEEESEENDYENISKEQPTTVHHRSRIQAAGSATQPRVLDFRSINNVKTSTSPPLSVLRASAKEAKEAEQREVDEILNRVLDAVMPMHRQMEAEEQMEETEF